MRLKLQAISVSNPLSLLCYVQILSTLHVEWYQRFCELDKGHVTRLAYLVPTTRQHNIISNTFKFDLIVGSLYVLFHAASV